MQGHSSPPQPTMQHGFRAAIPVAIGYIPAAIAYGILAKSVGFPLAVTLALSAFVYAGASQFAAVTMLAGGQSVVSTVALTFILNLRHLLMSTSLAGRIAERRPSLRSLIAFGITDETFSVASFHSGQLATPFLLGLNATAYASWIAGSALGFSVGQVLPQTVQDSMGIALYAMFVGLLIPSVRGNRVGLWVVMGSMAINTLAQLFVPPGLAIVVAALTVALVATLVLPSPR